MRPVRYLATVEGEQTPTPVEIEDLGNGRYALRLEGVRHEVDAVSSEDGVISLLLDGRSFQVELDEHGDDVQVSVGGEVFTVDVADERTLRLRSGTVGFAQHGTVTVLAPMPGKVVKLLVKPGDKVSQGQGLLVVEAMKMENELTSPKAGMVTGVFTREGSAVEANAKLLTVE